MRWREESEIYRVRNTFNCIYNFGKIILKPFVISETNSSCPRITEQIQIL